MPPEKFVEAVKEYQPDMVGLSAMLTTTMLAMKTTIASLQAAGLRNKVKIIVGGAPLTESFAQQIEADGFAADASRAAILALSMITSKGPL